MSAGKLSVKFKEGFYHLVPSDEYHSWPFVSSSILKIMLKGSAEKAKDSFDNTKEPTPSQNFGSMFHKLCLEPDDFSSEYTVGPECMARQKNGKRCSYRASICWRNQWLCKKHGQGAEHSGPQSVNPDEYNKAKLMMEKVNSHPLVSSILKDTPQEMKELSGQLNLLGLEMKLRLDCASTCHRTILDFKTCIDNSPEVFKNVAWNYGYWHQAFIYMEGARKLFGKNSFTRFLVCAVEKEPPFSIACYELGEEGRERAGSQLLSKDGPVYTWKECLATDKYPDHPLLMDLTLPKYSTYKKGD